MDQFEDKWEEIAKAYIPDGIREFQDYPLASLLRTTTQPSLFDNTTTGFPYRSGRKTRSQLT